MASCVVWIDYQNAEVFHISPIGVQKKHMEKNHHSKNPAHKDGHDKKEQEVFFHAVAKEIGDVEELLIFGSGLGKNHFKAHLEEHKHSNLLDKVVGVEALEHGSDKQILDASRKFFKKAHVFNSPLG